MIRVLDLTSNEEIKEYNDILIRNKNQNPFFLYDYFKTFSSNKGKLISFLYYDECFECNIVMPGYLTAVNINNVKTDYYHFSSPYGYTGHLILNYKTEDIIKKFWNEINQWYIEHNVVSEFIRFDLFSNYKMYDSNLHNTMLNIKGRITDEDYQWKSFDHKVRKNVNKALKEGLKCEIYYLDIPDIEIDKFYEVYIKTMNRTNANRSFFYEITEFKKFIYNNLNFNILCNIYYNNKVISSELVLVSNNAIYSFLGGTDENYFDKRPNDLLKFELINWARRNNKDFYILGGGYGYEDGIFKYKKSFFPNDVVTFYTGRKIVNLEKYLELVKQNNDFRISKLLNPLSIEDDSFFPIFNKQD